jgi:tetratricopeptide (TPR) repeat protein
MLYYTEGCSNGAMGLPRALAAHRQGHLEEAEHHYRRALEQGHQEAHLFQNYGALLRKCGKNEEALEIYARGLALHPHHAGILGNRANALREQHPARALASTLTALRLRLARDEDNQACQDLWITCLAILRELGASHWALALGRAALGRLGCQPPLLSQLLLLLETQGEETFQLRPLALEQLQQAIEERLQAAPADLQAELRLVLAGHALRKPEVGRALRLYEEAMDTLRKTPADAEEAEKRQRLIDVHSWNFGCALIKSQQLERGWRLYDYGLRAPAEGPQRWQRALYKPFSAEEIPLWRGESLSGKRLLLLDEQAIGDGMMFLTLVPRLLPEAGRIGLLLCDRLVPVYRRAFGNELDVWNRAEIGQGLLRAEKYDVQCPLGSIVQHRFTDPACYAPRVPMLRPKQPRSGRLRQQYLNHEGNMVDRLIGISWQGGGKPGRIRQKSMPLSEFEELLAAMPGVRFVSLQYGDVADRVQDWRRRGFDVLHDPRIDPLQDMNPWLDQVAACDAVISVANTTIHGAGGLDLPTLCLLSIHSDWRWYDDPAVARSIWYPSVGIARECRREGWAAAISRARRWIEEGCPRPGGPAATVPASLLSGPG